MSASTVTCLALSDTLPQDMASLTRAPDREPAALDRFREELRERIEVEELLQYLFHRQWMALKSHCNRSGIQIFGDIPIYVNYDSVDVWTHTDLFQLDESGKPSVVAGVPPDYFSDTGQLWGNPVYRWDVLKDTGYAWWIRRLEHNLRLFDLVRIDHFRGFEAYWAIPAHAATRDGCWKPGPGEAFLGALKAQLGEVPIVAEDLGIITEAVTALRRAFGIPGMQVLQFMVGAEDFGVFTVRNHAGPAPDLRGTDLHFLQCDGVSGIFC